jgi:hypothetical protein
VSGAWCVVRGKRAIAQLRDTCTAHVYAWRGMS